MSTFCWRKTTRGWIYTKEVGNSLRIIFLIALPANEATPHIDNVKYFVTGKAIFIVGEELLQQQQKYAPTIFPFSAAGMPLIYHLSPSRASRLR